MIAFFCVYACLFFCLILIIRLMFNVYQKANRSYQKDVAKLKEARDSNVLDLDDQESKYLYLSSISIALAFRQGLTGW